MPVISHQSLAAHGTDHQHVALPHGGHVETHRHDEGHLVWAARGVLSVTTTAGTWMAPATRMVWIPGGFDHHHRAYGSTDMRALLLPADLDTHLPPQPAVYTVTPLARELVLTLTARPTTSRSSEARSRLQAVLLDELLACGEEPLLLPEPRDDRLRAISEVLHNDPANNDTLAELGRAVGASQRTLTRLFHDELGLSFRQWRTQLRLHYALTMLAAGHSVTRTATACGWANTTSFIEAFTMLLGETPARHRVRLVPTP